METCPVVSQNYDTWTQCKGSNIFIKDQREKSTNLKVIIKNCLNGVLHSFEVSSSLVSFS